MSSRQQVKLSEFEFMAKMGRIVVPLSSTEKNKPPISFRIPELPQQDVAASDPAPLGRNMRAAPLGAPADNRYSNPEDVTQEFPTIRLDGVSDDVDKKRRLNMISSERERFLKEREMQQRAQQLVNKTLLENELREKQEHESFLKNIINKPSLEEESGRNSEAVRRSPFEAYRDDDLKEYVRKEFERLVPIRKEDVYKERV